MEVQLYLPSALDGCEWSNSRPVCLTVTDDPGSKPDQKYARRRDRQNYVGKNKVKYRTSSKRISLAYNILVHREGVDFEVTGIKFMTVFITLRDEACFLAKSSDLYGEKSPQHAFLRRGSKAVGPMS